MRINNFENCFVNRVPESLEEGVLYICLGCNVVVHLCACGCGEKVVLLIAPDHWQFEYDGEGISINPSIGNWYFSCRSHYYIKDSSVLWLGSTTVPVKRKQKKKKFFSRIKDMLQLSRKDNNA